MMKRVFLALALAGAISAAHGQASVFQQNQVYAGPTSGAGHGAPRLLVGGDLPNPGASSKGGVQSLTCAAHQWLNTISVSGVPACAQPSASDISGGAALTSANDTNVTVTLGGNPASALLAASSITMGWTGTLSVARGGTGQGSLTGNAFLTGNGTNPINQVAITGLVLGNGVSAPTAYGGVTCTNQFLTALSVSGAGTCTTDTLASAQHANQGTTTTVLHGNAAGNPSFGSVALTTDVSGTLPVANGGTGDTGSAWATFTPSPTCGTAAITTNSARSKTIGKTMFIEVDFTITSLGTCTASITFTLPSATAQSGGGMAGREYGVTGKAFNCDARAATTTSVCSLGDATNFQVNARGVASGAIEIQ